MSKSFEFKEGKWVEAKSLEFKGGLLWKLKKLINLLKKN